MAMFHCYQREILKFLLKSGKSIIFRKQTADTLVHTSKPAFIHSLETEKHDPESIAQMW